MEDSLNVLAVVYLLEHLSKGTDLLLRSLSVRGAPFGFVHDIELASRCLSDALNIVKKDIIDVHQSN